MSKHHHFITVWFFVGVLLLIYGLMILGVNLLAPDTHVVLAELHAGVWWGGVLTIVGAIYTYKFYPRKD